MTQILRFVTNTIYGDVDEEVLKRAQEKGTLIHELTTKLDLMEEIEVDEDIAGYLTAYVKFMSDKMPKWELAEHKLGAVYDGIAFAGTLDRVGTIGDKRYIVDLKTGKDCGPIKRKIYFAQLFLYDNLMRKNYNTELGWAILHLKSDGTYKFYDADDNKYAEEAFDGISIAGHCMRLQKLTTKIKKRKENAA